MVAVPLVFSMLHPIWCWRTHHEDKAVYIEFLLCWNFKLFVLNKFLWSKQFLLSQWCQIFIVQRITLATVFSWWNVAVVWPSSHYICLAVTKQVQVIWSLCLIFFFFFSPLQIGESARSSEVAVMDLYASATDCCGLIRFIQPQW